MAAEGQTPAEAGEERLQSTAQLVREALEANARKASGDDSPDALHDHADTALKCAQTLEVLERLRLG